MTDLRKAAERALDALEDIFGKEKKDVGAINALRQALAEPDEVLAEREACAKLCDEREKPNLYGVRECAEAIRARGNHD